MHSLAVSALALLGLSHSVAAHGYLKFIIVNGVSYPAWNVGQDNYITPEPVRYSRFIQDNGPVSDFTSSNITCNNGGNKASKGSIPVKPGDSIKLQWDQWGSSHSGPVMNYLAKCTNNDCSTFKGDTGAPWVKFEQKAYDKTQSPPWASDLLAKQDASWTVTLPSIAPGQYILRHEILGLHVAGTRMGAQFYPSCVQLNVSGSGSKQLPTGVALPGAYDPDDTQGVLVQLWRVNQGQVSYTAPGGPVIPL